MSTDPHIGRDRLKLLARLDRKKVRRETGLRLIEGPRLVEEALRAGCVSELFARAEAADAWRSRAGDARVHVLAPRDLELISDVKTPQEVVAIGPLPWPVPPERILAASRTVLLLDGVQDPGNVGTLARTAAALGVDGVLAGPGTADLSSPKVLRASAGALFRLPQAVIPALAELPALLGASGHRLVLPVVSGGEDVRAVRPPETWVLVAGSEARGTSVPGEGALAVTVPMVPGVESLNVSAAIAAILAIWWPGRGSDRGPRRPGGASTCGRP